MTTNSRNWVLSIGLSIAALIIPIILFVLSIEKKSFEYEVFYYSKLVGNESPMDGLEIKIGGEPVAQLSIHSFRIRNSGSVPILPKDFEKPILISIEDEAKIYKTRVKQKEPENLALNSKVIDDSLIIPPLLLNPGDGFEMDVYSSSDQHPKIDARIAGIAKINQTFLKKEKLKLILSAISAFSLLVFYGKFALAIPLAVVNRYWYTLLTNLLLITVIGLSAATLLKQQLELDPIPSNMFLSLIPIIIGYFWDIIERRVTVVKK